jgi:hypothetical protein
MIPVRFLLGAGLLATCALGPGCADTERAGKKARAQGPFVSALIGNHTKLEGGKDLSAELGQPVFLRIVLNKGGTEEDVEVGLDGPTVGEASYRLIIFREREPFDWGPHRERQFAEPAQSLAFVTIPADELGLECVVPVWFGEPGKDGVRRLVFAEPGRYFVRVQFPHVLKQPKYPHERPQWFRLTSDFMIVDVARGDPSVAAFAKAVAPFVDAKDVVNSKGRPLLRKYASEAEPPVKAWAQWMLLRSYAMDAGWWEALRKGDATAGEALDRLTPLAQQFVQEEAQRFRPPHFDALVILAARAAQSGNRDLALSHLSEARRRYGGMMLPREAIGLGESIPSTRPTTGHVR